jgi:hypothetical protein
MADLYAIRPITADEYAGFRRVHDYSFGSGSSPAVLYGRYGYGQASSHARRDWLAFELCTTLGA